MNTPVSARLAALRSAMAEHQVDAILVPTADPHLSEYLPGHWQARAWLSGFDGSAGTLVVTANEAGLWTDSRYFAQARQQLEGSGIALMKLAVPHAPEHLAWLEQKLGKDDVLAVAGDSVSVATMEQLHKALGKRGATVRGDLDLVDLIWDQRPPLPAAPVVAHDARYVATNRHEKLNRVRRAIHAQRATAHLLSSLDDIAWLLNLRGSDVECNPVFLAHLLLQPDASTTLFVDRAKLADSLVAELATDGIDVAAYDAVGSVLGALPESTSLLLDTTRVVSDIAAHIRAGVKVRDGANPSTLFKAIKEPVELSHIRAVMRRDGAALIRAFSRLEQRLAVGTATTELDVDALLHEARSVQPGWVGESFPTIAGYQANGALPHYQATAQQHAALHAAGLLLIDSGAQYLGGTTDITRVLALGETTPEQRCDATLVLKGMIALSRARFPDGASGPQLDALARAPLWACGMDYGHGTGHGVGYFLNVHEGPHGIRPPQPGGALVPLQPGMITSIEPGLYKPGRHGIRHENLAVVVAAEQTEFGDFLGFETLTLCPFDRRALEPSLLAPDDRAWLDDYHAQVRTALSPLLEGAELKWLEWHCAPV